ncbi:hypothetical protein ANN_18336, partial [Periplaneta americana]
MASPAVRKSNKEEEENELISIDEVAKETKGFIDRVLGDVGKSSATKQLVIGSISGWCTGFITMKVGKVAAIAVGGGIILLQVANHQGYINVNWDKVYKKIDKVADKVEEKATGQGPKWMEKVWNLLDINLIFRYYGSFSSKFLFAIAYTQIQFNFYYMVERYVDRKVDKAEDVLKRRERN